MTLSLFNNLSTERYVTKLATPLTTPKDISYDEHKIYNAPENGLLEAMFCKDILTNKETVENLIEPPTIMQSRLCHLWNASTNCLDSQQLDPKQKYSLDLWNHVRNCHDKNCKRKHCLSSRCIIDHFNRCKKSNQFLTCKLCGPVIKRILTKKQHNTAHMTKKQWVDEVVTHDLTRNKQRQRATLCKKELTDKETKKSFTEPLTIIQSRLFLLWNASEKCQDSQQLNPKQKYSLDLWNHIQHCQDKNCQRKHCMSSRCVVDHFNRCVTSNRYKTCKLCGPVIKRILMKKQHNTGCSMKKGQMDAIMICDLTGNKHPLGQQQNQNQNQNLEEIQTLQGKIRGVIYDSFSRRQQQHGALIRWETSVKGGQKKEGDSVGMQRAMQRNNTKKRQLVSLLRQNNKEENGENVLNSPSIASKKKILLPEKNDTVGALTTSVGPIKKRKCIKAIYEGNTSSALMTVANSISVHDSGGKIL